MIQTLTKNWWLLVVAGVLDAIISVIYLTTDGPMTFHAFHGTVLLLGRLTMAAGVCTIAAGIWSLRKAASWLLVLNGLACCALGAIFAFWTGSLAFRTVALVIVVMAVSLGSYEIATTRTSRHVPDNWLFALAGAVSLGFAVAFLAFVFGWIKLQPESPLESLRWLGSYFGFSAICMLGLALRAHSLRPSMNGIAGNASQPA